MTTKSLGRVQDSAEVSRIQEITALHNEIGGYLKMTLEKAIQIGELLMEQKDSMEHGEFTAWVNANLPFTDRTARNYMRLYKERDKLKTETVSDLTEGYRLLTAPMVLPMTFEEWLMHWHEAACYSELLLTELRKELDYADCLHEAGNLTEAIKHCKHVADVAGEFQNEWAEVNLRLQRRIGGLLIEVKDGESTGR